MSQRELKGHGLVLWNMFQRLVCITLFLGQYSVHVASVDIECFVLRVLLAPTSVTRAYDDEDGEIMVVHR